MKYLIPKLIDNDFKGKNISLYIFYLISPITIIRSLIHIFAPDGGAKSIANIPLHLYSKNASDTIIHIFSEWGLSQLIMGILYLIVLLI